MSDDDESITAKLAELEGRLQLIADALEDQNFNKARDEAVGLSDILDCPLCKNIENGVLGGIMFAGSLSPQGRDRRARMVQNEIEDWLDNEMEDAKERIEQLEAAD